MNRKIVSRRRKTLKLRRDSIRRLDAHGLQQAAGGTVVVGGAEPGTITKTTTSIWSAFASCQP